MAIELSRLPWAEDALAPHISVETIRYHYGKHHHGYVTTLNELIEGSSLRNKSLEEIIETAKGAIFDNAAQVWNHTFYWSSMKPAGGGKPTGPIAEAIAHDFDGYHNFRKQFTHAASSWFGSGWVWLVRRDNRLAIVGTPNAETPLTTSAKPVLVIDVWEHAYYIDHRNARPEYIETFLDHLVNWDFANRILGDL